MTAGLAGAAIAAEPSFTFRDATYMPADRGVEAARTFVAMAVPPGLPLQEVRRRLARADMTCGPIMGSSSPFVCDYSDVVHIQGGTIGEEHWKVILIPDGTGALQSATLSHFTVGVGDPNP